ncbi:TetR family transcriptional regulator [Sediminihabitans luteus]|uniref:TetR family transcriptional regulator n=1 Tax=Sediminihabitans luteus TaxID=1138585 RepID=A0A2M9CZN3_9CELL|nr:TetR/AcrR family transcriptional regulator [Sediminihabitans luteus]PJJ77208.1 TetR family transcriptional regulator [Sediminihabitans luteus]GII98656.1 TetR family transcriptional regulator [Sediminihabitans luteus]
MTSPTVRGTPVDARPLRADAERNRRRIVDAAREVFARHGLEAGLNEIARHAGVGVGTVYRRFPDKDSLVAAALDEEVARMLAVADAAQRSDDAWSGLVLLLEEGLVLLSSNVGLRDLLLSQRTDPLDDGPEHLFLPYVESLVDRARVEGTVRPDVTVQDVGMLWCMVSELARHSVDLAPDAWRRYLALFTAGLRAGAVPDVPPPLDEEVAQEVLTRWIGLGGTRAPGAS